MLLIYSLFVRLYVAAIRIASFWNQKAKEWTRGRENWLEKLSGQINTNDKIIWLHCASAGEFEQGKPLVEELKKTFPSHKILISFFSPSGFNAAKKYPYADVLTYLPADTKKNARQFVELVKPELVIFVKYEYWHHHLSAIAFHHIPLLMVSAIFRKNQLFFKPYGRFYKQILFLFRKIFVQDQVSLDLLKAANIHHGSLSGDTRFDRVKKIADHFTEVPFIKEFAAEDKIIVAGSTWEKDEEILASYVKNNSVKMVIVPHEIKREHIAELKRLFPSCILYSEVSSFLQEPGTKTNPLWNSINEQQQKDVQKLLAGSKTLIIDSMGMLSRIYHYATVTYVGGGFKSGIHNTLEAVVYGKPVLFGPKFQKFKEARDLIQSVAAFSINTAEELKTKMDHLLNDPEQLSKAGNAAKKYVEENTGATQKVLRYIQENRLLTN